MSTIDGLRLHSGVPPWIQNEHVVCGGQVQAQSPRLQTDQEHTTVVIRLKSLDPFFTVASLTVQVLVDDSFLVQSLTDNGQHTGELREDERFVLLFQQLFNMRDEHIQLGT